MQANTLHIQKLRVRPVSVPARIQPIAATGSIPTMPLVLIDLETDQGVTGRAYLFAISIVALKPLVEALTSLAPLLEGEALAPFELDAKLKRRLALLDTPGIFGLALAGIDMAAWDAMARAQQQPLVALLGGKARPIKAYNSCGLWIGDVDKLAAQAEQLVGEGGFDAIKLRLGRDDFKQDLSAVRSVKSRLGERALLMCDFNQRLSVAEAIRRGRALDDEGLYWIEEPVRHDDYTGAARVAEEVRTPIQIGENLLSPLALRQALEARAMDFVMPDVQRIGGVTGWLRAAALAHAFGIEMSSHLFPELSAHLLAVTPTCHYLEFVDWAAPILREPATVRDGHVLLSDEPGSGVSWDEAAVSKYLVA